MSKLLEQRVTRALGRAGLKYTARQTRKNYIHFLIMARGSLAELETQLIIAQELKFLPPTSELMESIKEVSRMLQGLITSLRQSERD